MPKHKTRGNGQGTAYKRGNTWEAQVVIGWNGSTPIKRRKGGFKTKADAINYCPILLSGGVVKQKHAPRLFEYWNTYSTNKMLSLSKSKQCAYKIAWNRLKKIHDIRVDQLTVKILQDTANDAAPTYYTRRDCKSLLTNLFALAGADQWADKDLPSFIELPSLDETEQTPFTPDEQKALWKLYESGERIAAIPLLMIYTGMMPGEAQKLRVEQIDLANQTITGVGIKTKVRKKTPVVIADSIVPLIQDLIDNAMPSGYIWKQDEEEWYSNYYLALQKAGCRKLVPYSCRHTTATALAITENIAPQTIKKIMRWSSTKMLDRYAHPNTNDALQGVNTIKKES